VDTDVLWGGGGVARGVVFAGGAVFFQNRGGCVTFVYVPAWEGGGQSARTKG
jgi:hypothetical protein